MTGRPSSTVARPWLRAVASIPQRHVWFTGTKLAGVGGASLLSYFAGTAESGLPMALGAAGCLMLVALAEAVDSTIRRDEQRQAEEDRRQARREQVDGVAEYGQLVNYTLTPIADVIARMLVTPSRADRRAAFASVYTLAVEALCDLITTATRAAYYELVEGVVTRMFANGPATQRSRFQPGSAAERSVLRLINSGDFIYIPDVRPSSRVTPSPGSSYRSVIAFSVRTDDRPFGMITVDSPQVDAFTEKDVSTVRVLAKLVASARAAVDATVSKPPYP